MYDTDGDFGQVRLVDGLFPPEMEEAAPGFTNAGWHFCNSRYRICRPDGAAVYLLLATVGGEGRLILDGRTYRLTPGTLAVVPPRRPTCMKRRRAGCGNSIGSTRPAGQPCGCSIMRVHCRRRGRRRC